jgi:hypothetical protein
LSVCFLSNNTSLWLVVNEIPGCVKAEPNDLDTEALYFYAQYFYWLIIADYPVQDEDHTSYIAAAKQILIHQ